MQPVSIKVYAGESSGGRPVFEDLPATKTADNEYCLLSSPGLVLGLARGDRIKFDEENGQFEIISRGGMVCVQVFVTPSMTIAIDDLIRQVSTNVNGMLDGRTARQVVFSIPVSEGFGAIEEIFNDFIQSNKDAEWYFGNVYDQQDGVTPLNWWNVEAR